MATSKTLTPTGVTIQIPEFTDQPDQRVNSNCIDKEADAINALNTQIVKKVDGVITQIEAGTVTQITVNLPTDATNWFIVFRGFTYATPSYTQSDIRFTVYKWRNGISASKVLSENGDTGRTITGVSENTTAHTATITFSSNAYSVGIAIAYKAS